MATRPTSAVGDGATTIIGESVQIKGTLNGDEDLHVLGRVDGRIELQRTLVVAVTGIVKAEVSVKNAIISGVVVGNVRASESVEITKEGRMVGDIYAPRVIIIDGASFRGNVEMSDMDDMPARRPASERPRPSPRAAPAPAKAKPAITRPSAPAITSSASSAASVLERTVQSRPIASAPMEPPAALGLTQKTNRTRVIVKRK